MKKKRKTISVLTQRLRFVELAAAYAIDKIAEMESSDTSPPAEIDLDEICRELSSVIDALTLLKMHTCVAIPLAESDLQDCLELQEEPPPEEEEPEDEDE